MYFIDPTHTFVEKDSDEPNRPSLECIKKASANLYQSWLGRYRVPGSAA